MNAILRLPIIDSPAMWIVYVVAVVLVMILLLRVPTARRVVRATIGIVLGAAVGFGLYLLLNALDVFGVELPIEVGIWAAAALAGVGLAIASMRRSRVWRKVVAAITVVWMLITATIGINAFYGLNPSLGSLFGIISADPIDLPSPDATRGAPDPPLYQTWQAPADMPDKGNRGTQAIPGTVSGFNARDAGIYLPPAALVEDAPPLPIVIMMMGHPGNPDVTLIGDALDQFAAAHDGLAPIAVVADQLGGDGTADPACADSTKFGKAETYVTTDVVNWARANLNVIDDPQYWIVAGYSNGGGCASKYGAKYPDVFKNIISVSGEEYPGSEDAAAVTTDIYGGDQAAFEASKPINIMKAAPAGTYVQSTGIFTAGSADPGFVAAAQAVASAAQAAGMSATMFEVPGADHGGAAVSGGLAEGFDVLAPVLGLAAS